MNKWIILLLLSSCGKPLNQGFVVKGDIEGLNNRKITVQRYTGEGYEVDTIFSNNNQFVYVGQVDKPYLVQLIIKKEESYAKLCEFMIENSEIKITGNSIDFDSINISGSKTDVILKSYFKESKLLDNKWDQLKLKYDKFVESSDSVNRKLVAKKLNYISKVEAVGLVKKYVRKHGNSNVGALIPLFCTVTFSKKDYLDMFSYLTSEIQKGGYGKEIVERTNIAE